MQTIACLGLGIMGGRMAARLLDAGFDVTVWNRSNGPTEPLRARGARVARSPAEAAAGAEAAITMLSDPTSVRDVALGAGGVVEALAAGTVYIDMTTVDPATARGLDCACRARGVAFLEAPVTGSKSAAEAGELVIMAGGEREVVDRVAPLFAPLAKRVVHMGPVGAGSTMKLVNNLVIAGSMLALFDALLMGRAGGLSDQRMLEVLTNGAMASPLLAMKGRAAAARDFEPHFAFKHMAKDIRLARAEAAALGVPSELTELLHACFTRGLEQGYDDEDFAALIKVVERSKAVDG